MLQTLFHLPILGWPIRSYGFMLMLGFLSAIWLAARRAQRVKADPDVVLNVGFIALIGGVVGARLFFVIHYWESVYAFHPNPLLAALDITGGGMEFYGGFLMVMVGTLAYLKLKGLSVRLYTDIMAPSLMWGLAFGRMGCFLNGCCWGAVCVDQQGDAALPWAVTFPYGSWASRQQWAFREATIPAELLYVSPLGEPLLVSSQNLFMSDEELRGPEKALRDAEKALVAARAAAGTQTEIEKLTKLRDRTRTEFERHKGSVADLVQATGLFTPIYGTGVKPTITELQERTKHLRSLPVHPAQLYSVINALLLALLLGALFARRKRQGIVLPVLFILYAVARMVLEKLRVDNPIDSAGMTVSTFISVVAIAVCGLWLFILYRMPLRSPRAVPFVPEALEEADSAKPAPA